MLKCLDCLEPLAEQMILLCDTCADKRLADVLLDMFNEGDIRVVEDRYMEAAGLLATVGLPVAERVVERACADLMRLAEEDA